MNIAVRYYTRSGNTKELADAIASRLGTVAESVDKGLLERADILFLGCSYYAFDVDEAVKEFIRSNKWNIGKIVLFGTSAMMKSAYKPVKKVTDETGVELTTEEFHCRGQFHFANKGRPNEEDLKMAADFAEKAARKVS